MQFLLENGRKHEIFVKIKFLNFKNFGADFLIFKKYFHLIKVHYFANN